MFALGGVFTSKFSAQILFRISLRITGQPNCQLGIGKIIAVTLFYPFFDNCHHLNL